ncbi:ATP-binding protein [Kitasatospora sp. NPDC001309]|uniref:ATP-binding protein n=1 Tax=Kitasatospora sp. NPDC001309 TaxID=3364013 RepID=UPI0036C53624
MGQSCDGRARPAVRRHRPGCLRGLAGRSRAQVLGEEAPPGEPQTRRRYLALTRCPGEPGTAAEARAFTGDFLADTADPRAVADAVLLVSELVGNALRHTGGSRALLLIRAGGRLRIEVSDASPWPPSPRSTHRAGDQGGLGLFLLDRLSLRWGWLPTGPGKTVWCELRLPAG